MDKVKEFKEKLRDLLKEYEASIGVNLEGDTYGLTSTEMVVDIKVDRKTETFIISNSCYFDYQDLEKI